MTAEHQPIRIGRRQLLILCLAMVALYIVIPQIGSFRHSLGALSSAHWSQLALAAICTIMSYFAAAGTYCLLAFKSLNYGRTVVVQIAGMFVNRLLPAGIGGIGINYAYLRESRHKGAEAAGVVAVNNALGLVGHGLLVLFTLLLTTTSLPSLQLRRIDDPRLIASFVLLALVLWIVLYRRWRTSVERNIGRFTGQLLRYRRRPARLVAALGTSVYLTTANVLCLWLCAFALHVSVPFAVVLLVFSFGVLLGTIAPTPGGLGGVETGLVGGFLVYHVPSDHALAIALTYRLVSYWLPLVAGAWAFAYSQRRGYF